MISETWLYRYRFVFGYLLLVFTGLFVLFYRLGDLLPGINWVEAESAAKSLQIGDLLLSPINFAFHLLQYVSISLLGPTALAIRLPGVLVGALSLALFFYIIDHRFNKRAAIITTLLLVSSSWFLNITRLGSASSLSVLLILLLIFIGIKLDDKYSFLWLLFLATTAGFSLYSPFFIYLLVAGVLLSLPSIRAHVKAIKNKDLYIVASVFVLLTLPLVYAVVRDLSVANEILALPESFPTLSQYFQNLAGTAGHVIWKSNALPILHLGTLPMLEIFSVSMVALGLYHYDHELSKNLSRLVLGGLLFTLLLVSVNADQFDFALLLPFVYFVLAGGLVILFTQWNEIFPKNPIARVIGIVPIAILLFIVGGYHAERYFVAWPNNPAVAAAHSEAYVATYEELEQNAAYTAVLNSSDEVIVMQPINLYYPDVLFFSDISDFAGNSEERRLIITNAALLELPKETREKLGAPSRTVSSAYTSQTAVLWIYDVPPVELELVN